MFEIAIYIKLMRMHNDFMNFLRLKKEFVWKMQSRIRVFNGMVHFKKLFYFKMSKTPIEILGMHSYKNFMYISCIKRLFWQTNLVPDPCLECNGHHSYWTAPRWWGC